jgi:hypothetical protein
MRALALASKGTLQAALVIDQQMGVQVGTWLREVLVRKAN